MREILFRGKTKSGEWVYGSLDQSQQTGRGEILIRTHDMDLYWNSKMVTTETIGQFTGLTDKNGVKIFEHDIVKMYSEIMPEWAVTIKKVEWYKEEGRWNLGQRDARMIWEVIGNIHDQKDGD